MDTPFAAMSAPIASAVAGAQVGIGRRLKMDRCRRTATWRPSARSGRTMNPGLETTARNAYAWPTPKPEFPELEQFDELFKKHECETFRDPSSRNAKAIKHTFHGT